MQTESIGNIGDGRSHFLPLAVGYILNVIIIVCNRKFQHDRVQRNLEKEFIAHKNFKQIHLKQQKLLGWQHHLYHPTTARTTINKLSSNNIKLMNKRKAKVIKAERNVHECASSIDGWYIWQRLHLYVFCRSVDALVLFLLQQTKQSRCGHQHLIAICQPQRFFLFKSNAQLSVCLCASTPTKATATTNERERRKKKKKKYRAFQQIYSVDKK